ncbi:PAP-specific phosphatase HAL2-like [Selaginella moellendorffii]|uniref:PAP-specific phosphatase HAL2-like n=1 Tax=Selaginella moellendorffii TaxID=88036 RepID=UPI000D1D09C6|nr:PAP-specific phosphatase HAL2-like [Selaginella moellendorffii]|eukprot:XP_024540678.1 PAP-specific phosphatase HAL2-like [Selaginella moellendorffii]
MEAGAILRAPGVDLSRQGVDRSTAALPNRGSLACPRARSWRPSAVSSETTGNIDSRAQPRPQCLEHNRDGNDKKITRGVYAQELEVAARAVQLGCMLAQRVQERILRKEENAGSKDDKSLVTVADWGVQAVVSWVLSQAFGEEVSIIAEEDTKGLKGMNGIQTLQRVVAVVNECLSQASVVGLTPPSRKLGTIEVLRAINKGNSEVRSSRSWVLDPVDGTLGFVRGDQYAIALGMIEDGRVVLGVLGCPNYPMRPQWLNYHQKYYRLASKIAPPPPGKWHKGCVLTSAKGAGQAWMEPLVWNSDGSFLLNPPRVVAVSPVDDPAQATFCEPVEKANSSHSFTEGVADSLGLRKRPLRVYSMAKYAAIARGDAEIFMKFARAGYKEKIWDHAAGVLIVEEAGGVVTDAGGRPLDFSKGRYVEGLDRGIIVSCGTGLHRRIISAVDASWNSSKL